MKRQVQANKIKLVVSDALEQTSLPEQPAHCADAGEEPSTDATKCGSDTVSQSTANEPGIDITDVEKLMTEVPVDDFFKALESASPAQLQSLVRTLETGAKSKHGSNVISKLIGAPAEPRSLISVIWWWECRRWLYNAIVGLTGLPFAFLIWLLLQRAPVIYLLLLLGIAYYGIGANICYSLGAPAELVAKICWKEKGENYGPVLLTLGLIFSVLLTVIIGVLCLLAAATIGFATLPVRTG